MNGARGVELMFKPPARPPAYCFASFMMSKPPAYCFALLKGDGYNFTFKSHVARQSDSRAFAAPAEGTGESGRLEGMGIAFPDSVDPPARTMHHNGAYAQTSKRPRRFELTATRVLLNGVLASWSLGLLVASSLRRFVASSLRLFVASSLRLFVSCIVVSWSLGILASCTLVSWSLGRAQRAHGDTAAGG